MNSLKFFSTLEKNIILEKKYYFNKKREDSLTMYFIIFMEYRDP